VGHGAPLLEDAGEAGASFLSAQRFVRCHGGAACHVGVSTELLVSRARRATKREGTSSPSPGWQFSSVIKFSLCRHRARLQYSQSVFGHQRARAFAQKRRRVFDHRGCYRNALTFTAHCVGSA
jgi:hypothetical protein